jgi:5-formyltetrahydrofolate cyclo-ligase
MRGLRARRVGVYLAVGSELSTAPLISGLLRRGSSVWVPAADRSGGMRFLQLRANARLRPDALGVPRPACARITRTAATLDLLILPLLAYDQAGTRLGSGGGYYDRALAGKPRFRPPKLIGYAFAEQLVSAVPVEPWDVRLDAVVSSRGCRRSTIANGNCDTVRRRNCA